MWRLVACCPLNYTSMASKNLFNYHYLSFILLAFIFLTTINGINSHVANSNLSSSSNAEDSDHILCRLCGADLGDAKHIINHLSPDAAVVVNQTIFERKGVEVQLLKNPLGIQFQTIALSNSKCAAVHNWHDEFTWYPGYSWKPCICSRCRAHHGWFFKPVGTTNFSSSLPTHKGFFILKLNNLLSENFANSLIVIPKSYLN